VGSVGAQWAIYRALIAAHVRSRMQYRLSFWVGFTTTFAADLVQIALLGVLFTRFPDIAGWTWREVALLYGLGQMATGLLRSVSRQLDNFDQLIVAGDFDTFLIRPLSPLFHVLAARFEIAELGRALCGVAVFALAARTARVPITLANAVVTAGAILGGMLIWFSLMWIVAALAFWHGRTGKLQDVVQTAGRELVTYPLGIYPGWVRAILTWALPLALITYYPAARLLGRPVETLLAVAAVPAGLVLLALAAVVWRYGLRHYQSTGS
jgi:viologen exporter family transport system permease protein